MEVAVSICCSSRAMTSRFPMVVVVIGHWLPVIRQRRAINCARCSVVACLWIVIIMMFVFSFLDTILLEKQKSRGLFPLLSQHAGGQILLSPKGPPSCWRAKPIIKLRPYKGIMTEHMFHNLLLQLSVRDNCPLLAAQS